MPRTIFAIQNDYECRLQMIRPIVFFTWRLTMLKKLQLALLYSLFCCFSKMGIAALLGKPGKPICMFLDPQHVWQSCDPMSIQNFDFCEKKVIIPLFSFCIFLFFASFFFPLKRYNRWNFFSFTSAWLSAHSYPPLSALLSDQLFVSYLMLPNLTNQFIKLSDGE